MRISKTIAAIIVVLVVIFLLCVGVLVGIRVNAKGAGSNDVSLSPYSAVYLSTGDVYFGKLDWSPSPHIEDPWFLQRGTDPSGNATVGVYPFSQVAWGPSDAIYFNSQNIVFWTRLSSTSSVAEVMANPSGGVIQETIPSGAPSSLQ